MNPCSFVKKLAAWFSEGSESSAHSFPQTTSSLLKIRLWRRESECSPHPQGNTSWRTWGDYPRACLGWGRVSNHWCINRMFFNCFFCRSLQSNVRSVSSMHVLDSPGFQNPASLGRTSGASFEDLCHNYECERLQKFFHHTVFTAQMERYSQVQCSTCCLVCTHVATSPTNQGPDSTPWNKCFFVGRFINWSSWVYSKCRGHTQNVSYNWLSTACSVLLSSLVDNLKHFTCPH